MSIETIKAVELVKGLGLAKGLEANYMAIAKKVDHMEQYEVDCQAVRHAMSESDYPKALHAFDALSTKWHRALTKHYKKQGAVYVDIDSIKGCPDNPRIQANGRGLVDSIAANGLECPIMIDQHNTIIQGHRRHDGLQTLKAVDPDAYKFWFSQGIPVDQREVTPTEFVALLCDHGSSEPLNNPYEIFASFALLYRQGSSEAQCMETLRTAIDRVMPSGGKTLTRLQSELAAINDTQKEIAEATEPEIIMALNAQLKAQQKEYTADWQSVRRGTAQYWSRMTKLPQEVADSYFFQCTSLPKGEITENHRLLTTQKNVTDMEKAFRADVANSEGNRLEPGPLYVEARGKCWAEEGETAKKAVKTKGKPKAMSHANIMKPVEEGQVCSKGLKAIARKHAGFDIGEDTQRIDYLMLVAETISETNPELWQSVEDCYLANRKKAASRVAAN